MAEKEIMSERKRWLFLGLPFTFTKFVITEKKLVIETGFFVSKESEILHYRILDMNYSRNVLQKMFGLGTIKLYAQDVTHPELIIKNIKHSREFKDTLSELTESEKRRLSVRRGEVVGAMVPHEHLCDECDIDDEIDSFEHPMVD